MQDVCYYLDLCASYSACLTNSLIHFLSLSYNPQPSEIFKQTIEAYEYHHIKFNVFHERRFERGNLHFNYLKEDFRREAERMKLLNFPSSSPTSGLVGSLVKIKKI